MTLQSRDHQQPGRVLRRRNSLLKPSEVTALRSRLQALGLQTRVVQVLQRRGRMLAAGLRRDAVLDAIVTACRELPRKE
jgi:hypothetical protein